MAERRRSWLVAVVAALLLCAACGAKSGTPTAGPTAKPTPAPAPPAAPALGACYRLSTKQAVAPTSDVPASSCKTAHTAETFRVGELDTAVDGHLLAVDSARVATQVASACRSRLTAFLGGSASQARLSMVRPVWFTPTVEQSDAGANWFRCDALVVGAGGSLVQRTGSLAGVLKSPKTAAAVAMCGTDAPSAKSFKRVPCSLHHSWRATQVVPISGSKYPGAKAAKAAGHSRCEDAASSGAKNPLNFRWGYEWPTAQDWARAQHYGICWAEQD